MTRCPTCDRREATDEEWQTVQPGDRADLCWGEPGCSASTVDWRERALAAEADLTEATRLLAGFVPSPTTEVVGWKHAPEGAAQNAVTWAVECCAHALRQELAHAPAHKQNRMTATIYFGEEKWSLTLARGDYEHRVEAQRDEARKVATLAVRCHLSPSDDVRARGFREAKAAVDGWEVGT